MVIQRNWKIASNTTDTTQNPSHSSSSDDSNSSWQTNATAVTMAPKKAANVSVNTGIGGGNSNTVTTVTATVKSHISNPQMAESVHRALKNRLNGRSHVMESNAESAARSMELMRLNVQDVFNQEIDGIVSKYIDSFFKPAMNNIKENLGEKCLSDDFIQSLSCTLLDNAKSQYGFSQTTTTIKTEPLSCGPNSYHQQTISQNSSFKRKITDDTTNNPTGGQLNRNINRTKQVYWNVCQLNSDTRFVLDFKANRALGFADSSKERLASKHPELIRYLPDAVDKEWLFQQQIISAANKNNRFLLLVHCEVLKVARSDAYKSTAKIGELDSFRIPDFMLQKMKIFFTELSLRSQTFVVHPVQSSSSSGEGMSSSTSQSVVTNPSSGFGQPMMVGGTHTSRSISRSTLSSSHATLSALLSGGSMGQISPAKSSVSSSNKLTFQMSKDMTAGPSSSVMDKHETAKLN